MFFEKNFVKHAYQQLKNLDPSAGKSRKEKVSGLRYLFAISQLLKEKKTDSIDLAVGNESRHDFVDAVGDIIALDSQGLYTKDFAQEYDKKKDYGVGSNFLTTRLANSQQFPDLLEIQQ